MDEQLMTHAAAAIEGMVTREKLIKQDMDSYTAATAALDAFKAAYGVPNEYDPEYLKDAYIGLMKGWNAAQKRLESRMKLIDQA